MEKKDIKLKLEEILFQILTLPSATEIADSANLITDLKADNADLIDIIMEIESIFGCYISDEEAEKLITVADLVNYIDNKLTKKEDSVTEPKVEEPKVNDKPEEQKPKEEEK